ncbi:MAG: response regulator transcription factor [Xanthobacteraceae bacterium]
MSRILILDEQAVYREGLCDLISTKIPCAQVFTARSPIEALRQTQNGTFDLVLLGLDPSNAEVLDILKVAREASAATCFAIVSASDARADILASLAVGLHGFISKHQSDAAIIDGITRLLSGQIYLPPSLAEERNSEPFVNRSDSESASFQSTEADFSKLTKRQREVLQLLARGMSNKEIARVLKIAEATTKIHTAALLRALGARNRTEAAYKVGNLMNSPDLANTERTSTINKKA